jgi:extracellular elastinolytic metalloproteinase
VQSHLGLGDKTVEFHSGFSSDEIQHAYVKQLHDGVSFANAVANVAFNKENKVVAFGSSFVKPKSIPSSKPTISLEDAISAAEKALEGKFNGHKATLEYLALEDGSVALTHVVQIQNEASGVWKEAFIDAHTGRLISVTDFVAKASYRVVPITKQDPRDGFELLVNPQDTSASPNGWHTVGGKVRHETAGNNVISFKKNPVLHDTTKESSPTLNFDYRQDPNAEPTVQTNLDAARTNAFYTVNTVHDIAYKYGFTEAAFNFQDDNFNKGGKGGDRVQVSVQDSSGTDNADFATPPDGQSGRMRMFLWDFTKPERDGALENDIVVHENTHGITNRMTGGGTGRCLQTTEAGGMGEGWSDAMAEWTEQKNAQIKDFTLGSYVVNNPSGIRTHPYSTSATTNPLRYSSLKTLTEVHDIGEVWANMLHNVYAALVGSKGFSGQARTNPNGTKGNVIFLHLFIDALPLQPCNPTFLSARDAWIQADVNRYQGNNKCTLWKAFASRGLGMHAADHNDDSTVPSDC